MYVFDKLNLGCILISDFAVANLFMHSLPGIILLYLATLIIPKVFLHEILSFCMVNCYSTAQK